MVVNRFAFASSLHYLCRRKKLYQFNNQHSYFVWFVYGNDLAKVRLLLPAYFS